MEKIATELSALPAAGIPERRPPFGIDPRGKLLQIGSPKTQKKVAGLVKTTDDYLRRAAEMIADHSRTTKASASELLIHVPKCWQTAGRRT